MTTPILSPCVHICKLNAQQECIGCGRLLEEIVEWGNYSDDQREAIMQRLQARAQGTARERSENGSL